MASREKDRRTMSKKHARFLLGAVIGMTPIAFYLPAQAQVGDPPWNEVAKFSATHITVPIQGGKVPKAVFTVTNKSRSPFGLMISPIAGCQVQYPKSIQPHKKGSISIICPSVKAEEGKYIPVFFEGGASGDAMLRILYYKSP